MSKVGMWLLGMQEDAFSLLNTYSQDEARRLFLMHNCGEHQVFEDCLQEWNGWHGDKRGIEP